MSELEQQPVTPVPPQPLVNAGFWLRLLAHIIDKIIVSSFLSIFSVLFGIKAAISMIPMLINGDAATITTFVTTLISSMMMFIPIAILTKWLYFTLMESSSMQATVGKMALGIKVTDLNGERVTFARATGRHFSKIISSAILGIGYIMAAFTEKKQGLHDIIAGTLVVKK